MAFNSPNNEPPTVGILILNYHQPEVTLACIRRLLEVEGKGSCILWLENDAKNTFAAALPTLEQSGLPWIELDPASDLLPPAGCVGFISIPENLGYAGGNNVGLRFLKKHNIEFAWVMNNDTFLETGSSRDLVTAARQNPQIGLWGVSLRSPEGTRYSGASLQLKDFSMKLIHGPHAMEQDPLSYVSGCALFFSVERAASLGLIPEDYFLYYEDPAFSMEFRRRGMGLSVSMAVTVQHAESLSTGRRSPLMEYYSRRNRWAFIQRYFPDRLPEQRLRVWYRFQSLLFRAAFNRMWLEWLAMRDWGKGRMGKSDRLFNSTWK